MKISQLDKMETSRSISSRVVTDLTVSNLFSCSEEAVQFSASFVTFLRILWHGKEICIFFIRVTLLKIVNT